MSHITSPGKTLGQLIRRARCDAGLSHDRLAEKIGTTRSHLIKLEKGQHRPRPEMLARIAEGTGKSIEFFESGSAASDDEEAAELMPVVMAAVRVFTPMMKIAAKDAVREILAAREGATT